MRKSPGDVLSGVQCKNAVKRRHFNLRNNIEAVKKVPSMPLDRGMQKIFLCRVVFTVTVGKYGRGGPA